MGYKYNPTNGSLVTQWSENPDFWIQVSLGKVPGCFNWRQQAYLPNIQIETGGRDIWEYGSTTFENIDYTYPLDNTAPIDTVSSSNAADTQPVLITGLDINGKWTQQEITLTGQTKVTLPTTLWRFIELISLETTNDAKITTGFVGNVYVYEDTAITGGVPTDTSKVRGFVNKANNISQQCQFTVPAGYQALFIQTQPRIIYKPAAGITITSHARPFGRVFTIVDQLSLNSHGTTTVPVESVIPTPLSEKTDILLRGDSDTQGAGIGTIQDIVMFDQELWRLT